MKKNNTSNNVPTKFVGNYTKSAIKEFEENIVNETDFLEKVDRTLNDTNKKI